MGRAIKSQKIETFTYLSHFIIRSFLIAVFCSLSFFAIIITVYLGDLYINVKRGNFKNPLFSTYVIVSPSMVPTIMINDGIVVQRKNHDEYNIGDIITFSSSDINYEGLLITHRIVDKKEESSDSSIYITKGDNNELVDPSFVKTEAIYGKVLFKIPKLGYLQDFFLKPINYFLCLLIPSLIFVIYEFYRIGIIIFQKKVKSN